MMTNIVVTKNNWERAKRLLRPNHKPKFIILEDGLSFTDRYSIVHHGSTINECLIKAENQRIEFEERDGVDKISQDLFKLLQKSTAEKVFSHLLGQRLTISLKMVDPIEVSIRKKEGAKWMYQTATVKTADFDGENIVITVETPFKFVHLIETSLKDAIHEFQWMLPSEIVKNL